MMPWQRGNLPHTIASQSQPPPLDVNTEVWRPNCHSHLENSFRNKQFWAGELAQQGKALTAKPEKLVLIFGTYIVEGESQLLQVIC